MKYHDVKMGKLLPQYNNGSYQDITFCVTEECNLRCKYCYMYNKNSMHTMTLETAKKAVDYILQQPPKFPAAVWNFIGGEPTLEMDLVDQITDYINYKMYVTGHPWFDNHVFLIDTNGLLYHTDKVQHYAKKNEGNVQFAITIDGNKEKHDLSRVTKEGKGSYDIVEKNVRLWIKQTPGSRSTKSTFSSADLPYLKDSIINLWNLGLDVVAANVVFENVWQPNDPLIYEDQLIQLADYIIDNQLWDQYSVRFFDPSVGYQNGKGNRSKHFCGTGIMITVSTDGHLYPCIRFLDFCMSNNLPGYCVGDITTGFQKNKLKAFESLSIEKVSDTECLTCPIASGCMSCTGNCYDDIHGLTLFHRTKYHCEMQKAQVRAIKYFWKRYSEVTSELSPRQLKRYNQFYANEWSLEGLNYLVVLCDENTGPICNYSVKKNSCDSINNETIRYALQFAEDNDMVPAFLTSQPEKLPCEIDFFVHFKIFPAECTYEKRSPVETDIPVYQNGSSDVTKTFSQTEYCMLTIEEESVSTLKGNIKCLSEHFQRIILNPISLEKWSSEAKACYNNVKELSAQSSILSECSCTAGTKSYTLDSKGNLFLCPAFYYSGYDYKIGSYLSCVPEKFKLAKLKNQGCGECTPCFMRNKANSGDILFD